MGGVSVIILLGCICCCFYSVATAKCMPLLLFSRDGEVYAVAPIQSRRRGVCRCSYSVATVRCMPLLLFSRDGEVYAVASIQSRR